MYLALFARKTRKQLFCHSKNLSWNHVRIYSRDATMEDTFANWKMEEFLTNWQVEQNKTLCIPNLTCSFFDTCCISSMPSWWGKRGFVNFRYIKIHLTNAKTYETLRFNVAFTMALQYTYPVESIHFLVWTPISLRSILILSSHLRLGTPTFNLSGYMPCPS